MTQNKRFVAIGVEWVDGFIQDHIDDRDLFNIGAVCKLLNELSEENEQLKQQIKDIYKFVKYDVDNEIEVYPRSILEHLVNILKIIGDVE